MSTTATYPVATEQEFVNTHGTMSPERKVLSSVIISEEVMAEVRRPNVKYVQVPVVEEVVKKVPVKSVVEVEKLVPRVEVEYVEKIVEFPQIHYIDRQMEKEITQEIVHEIPGKLEICSVPRTVIRKKPLITNVVGEKIVEVPGPVVDVTKSPVEIEPLKQYHDVQVPVVVAQTIRPIITQYDEYVDVDVVEYEPEFVPVDIYVDTPIGSKLRAVGVEQDVHNCVSIPPAQYNTILKSLNPHISPEQADQLPFIKTNGKIGFLSSDEAPGYVRLDFIPPNQEHYNNDDPAEVNQMENRQKSVRSYAEDGDAYVETTNEYLDSDNFERMVSVASRKPVAAEKKKRIFGC